jgi:hypothetical protein
MSGVLLFIGAAAAARGLLHLHLHAVKRWRGWCIREVAGVICWHLVEVCLVCGCWEQKDQEDSRQHPVTPASREQG